MPEWTEAARILSHFCALDSRRETKTELGSTRIPAALAEAMRDRALWRAAPSLRRPLLSRLSVQKRGPRPLSSSWGFSSNGRALGSHSRGNGIDTRNLHFFFSFSRSRASGQALRASAPARRTRLRRASTLVYEQGGATSRCAEVATRGQAVHREERQETRARGHLMPSTLPMRLPSTLEASEGSWSMELMVVG